MRYWRQKAQENDIGINNITSVGVIRKASWTDLKILSFVGNYFADAKNLLHGCFPQINTFYVYSKWEDGEDKNQSADQCFPAKMQAISLQRLGIQEGKFCFNRCIARVLKQRWPHVSIN